MKLYGCKKGSLNLSINAIVVLILAITMLGLGLSFMKNIFGGATEEFQKVGGTVEKQMIEQMKAGKNIVELSRPSLDLKKAGKDQIFIGLKNVQAGGQEFKIIKPDKNNLGGTEVCSSITINKIAGGIGVSSGDTRVLPINVQADSDANEGTCFIDLITCANNAPTPGVGAADDATACGADDETFHAELTIDVIV